MRLFRDLRQHGYTGGYGVVAAYARRLRQAQGLPPGHRVVVMIWVGPAALYASSAVVVGSTDVLALTAPALVAKPR